MKTLTLFNAYVKAYNIRDYFAGKDIAPKYEARHERLFRQMFVFEDAIRARLTREAQP